MNSKSFVRLRITVIALVVIILGIGSSLVVMQAEKARSQLPVLGNIPQFEFVTQSGAPFGRFELLGKITVVDFVFTRCKGPCPIMSRHMSELYELFSGEDRIQFVSITVDPQYDSLAVLAEYAESKGVTDSRWVFLWAPIDSVVNLSEQGFMLAAEDLPGSHTTKWVLLDERADIRGYYSGTDPASIAVLKQHIALLAKKDV